MMLLLNHPIVMFSSYFRCLPTRRCINTIRRSSVSPPHQTLTMDSAFDASSTFLLRKTDPKKNVYTLSDILHYLNLVQEILESSDKPSPAIKYDHCYQKGNNNTTFFKLVGNVLAKPMLRTLIYNDQTLWYTRTTVRSKKIHFDQRIREEKASLGFDRLYSFVINTLRPAAILLDEDLRSTFIPDLLQQIEMIEQKVQKEDSAQNLMRWNGLFCRLASGRYYQGKLEAMILDLFPQHIDEFHVATRKITEREVLERVIQHDLVDALANSVDQMSDEDKIWMQRRISAARKCLDTFYTATDDESQNLVKQDHLDGIKSGKRCEKSCLEFLQDVYQGNNDDSNWTNMHVILTNVYVNNRRKPHSEPGQKYIPPKMHRRGASHKQKELGVIWTDYSSGNGNMSSRHRECSEFDAVILNFQGVSFDKNELSDQVSMDAMMDDAVSKCAAIESIFEAKRTISPSTLHDILTKKLKTIEALLEDTSAELAYRDIKGMVGSAPISSNSLSITFGIYGVELLPPGNAADSIRSIAGSNTVSSNIHEVICALERGSYNEDSSIMVEVEIDATIEIVKNLKAIIKEKIQSNMVDIIFILEEEACFLRT